MFMYLLLWHVFGACVIFLYNCLIKHHAKKHGYTLVGQECDRDDRHSMMEAYKKMEDIVPITSMCALNFLEYEDKSGPQLLAWLILFVLSFILEALTMWPIFIARSLIHNTRILRDKKSQK